MIRFDWLKRVWNWWRRTMAYLFTRTQGSKSEHDSDNEGSEDYNRSIYTASGFIDETDHHVSNARLGREGSIFDIQEVPRPRAGGNSLKLKNPYCIVVVNINFENAVANRNGAQADLENLERLLRRTAGFRTVDVQINVTSDRMLKIMEKVSNSEEIAKHDGLIVFISSHGRRKGILMTDRKIVEVDDLTKRVNGRQCANLLGKPKLFFISACRGKKVDAGVSTGNVTSDSGEDHMCPPRLPTEADFMICYATTLGNIAHRRYGYGVHNNEGMGTWLISRLTEVFEERMGGEDVMQMMTRVNSRVANMSSGGDSVDGEKQMPVQMHMLRHRVFLGK